MPLVDPPIAAHRLIGNGRATALVLPDGSIDWWCAPEPDDAPLLWRLLDPSGPCARWSDADSSGQAPPVAGPAVRTTVSVDGVLVQLLDALVRVEGWIVLGRFARAVDVGTTLTHEVGVGIGGFETDDAADDTPWWRVTGDVAEARPEDRRVVVKGTGPTAVIDGVARTTVDVVADRWQGLVLVVGDGDAPDPCAVAGQAEAELRAYDDDLTTCEFPERLGDVCMDALAVVIACTCSGSGAIIAAPTTSLPEVIGGDRQFDYRYCWLRDSAQAVSVSSQLGRHEAARRLFDFLGELGPQRLLESPVFTVRGGDVPEERELSTVSGWRGSRPARVGNDASGQVQHDVLGIVVEAITAFEELGDGLRPAHLSIVAAFADRALEAPDATNGIWEFRQPAQLVSADIGRWVALDRAVALARRHRRVRWARRARHWSRVRDEVRTKVLGALRPDGSLPRAYDDEPDVHDASALLAVIYGLIEPEDPRAHRLVDATLRTLGEGVFVRRYRGVDDGFAPGEGAFVPCSWWAVSALAILGRQEEALDRARAIREVLPGIQPEEVDVATGEGRGNVPLVWSHTEAARAAILVDRAQAGPADADRERPR